MEEHGLVLLPKSEQEVNLKYHDDEFKFECTYMLTIIAM